MVPDKASLPLCTGQKWELLPAPQSSQARKRVCVWTYPLYDTVIPATLEFSQPMAKKNRDRTKPSRDVPKANLAAPITPSLYFFMTRPPENIPRATAGMLTTPKQSKSGHQRTTHYRGCVSDPPCSCFTLKTSVVSKVSRQKMKHSLDLKCYTAPIPPAWPHIGLAFF